MTSREQFEEFVDSSFPFKKDRFHMFRDEYKSQFTRQLWEAWQAASKASEQQLAAVVAENAGLKVKGRELLNEACKVYEKFNGTISSDSGDFIDGQTLHEFQFLLDVETPATDAAIANIQAQGVELVIAAKKHQREIMHADTFGYGAAQESLRALINQLESFAAQLRQGAAQ